MTVVLAVIVAFCSCAYCGLGVSHLLLALP